MMAKDKPPAPIVIKAGSRLTPVSSYDADELERYAIGTEFDLVARTKRSLPQNGTYWKTLDKAVQATGRWPSREALHTALKVKLGHVDPIFGMDGRVVGMQPQSTAFEAMTHVEFRDYMDRAMAELSEALGYDALQWMKVDA